MTQYQVQTPDGQVHSIEAYTHMLDSNGLTLYLDKGVAVAIFPKFDWMRQAQVVVAEQPSVPVEPQTSGTSTPVASGE